MPDLAAIREKARGDLHRLAQVPALYIETEGADPLPVGVRVHKSASKIGHMPGMEGVEMRDLTPRIIFLIRDVPMPRRNAIVSIAAGEAYRVGETLPRENNTDIAASVAPLTAAQAADLPLPDRC